MARAIPARKSSPLPPFSALHRGVGGAAARKLALTLTLRVRFNISEHDRPAWSAAQAPLPREMREPARCATSEVGSGNARYPSRSPAGYVPLGGPISATCRGARRPFGMRAEFHAGPAPGPGQFPNAERNNAYLSAKSRLACAAIRPGLRVSASRIEDSGLRSMGAAEDRI